MVSRPRLLSVGLTLRRVLGHVGYDALRHVRFLLHAPLKALEEVAVIQSPNAKRREGYPRSLAVGSGLIQQEVTINGHVHCYGQLSV